MTAPLRDWLARLLSSAFYGRDMWTADNHPPWPPGWQEVADALLASEEWQAREAVEVEAIFLLLRAYESGHRHGWEPGPSSQETMDGIFTWLCNIGFDPNENATPQFLPGIRARLAATRGEETTI